MHAKCFLRMSCLVVLIAAVQAQEDAGPSPITLRSLLTEMTDVASVARWPRPEYKVMRFDGQQTVWAPVGDFFGSALASIGLRAGMAGSSGAARFPAAGRCRTGNRARLRCRI